MKIALMGYGAMGRLAAEQAREEGHEIGRVCTSKDSGLNTAELAAQLHGHDVAIDFSVAQSVVKNVLASLEANVPIVVGTTGWKADEARVRESVARNGGGLVFGANFSIGVNLFYRIVANAAMLVSKVSDYDPFIEEAHHKRKKDAPSGTALRLQEILATGLTREIPISSTRAGYIPGTHRVGFDSVADQILLTHTARSREGFAAGALVAARWIIGRRGVFEFTDVLDEMVKGQI